MFRTVSTHCKPKQNHIYLTAKRLRSTTSTKSSARSSSIKSRKTRSSRYYNAFLGQNQANSPFIAPPIHQARGAPPENLTGTECGRYFEAQIKDWATSHRTLTRFARFGYEAAHIQPFLDAYVSTARSGFFSSPDNFIKYQLIRFALNATPPNPNLRLAEAEATFSNIFFTWVLSPADSSILDTLVSFGKAKESTLDSLRHLAHVSLRRPTEDYTWARKMRRKVIMHVGPTNSGKTHHALRALAAAKSGVYAGPLRLLAHEIWERLNLGQIVPLGVEQAPLDIETHSPSSSSPSQSSSLSSSSSSRNPPVTDPSIAPEATKLNFNPLYARPTNMLTGEEQKIVSDTAPLLSCTVEMLSFQNYYDVGVVDEIQMIGDVERGFAWTSAVLGLCAKELHLCGEESAIPVVQELLKETGDELVIRKYERLSPLMVEEKSLGGDLSKIQKGDCVVAFSRTRIFGLKNEIEKKSNLRCAVVYGKLPPEIRSEQAALFNDPDSGFDVIIGSDAIGMGLNLKIRRIIFDSTSKSDGTGRQTPLSISQIKQISGRAGRYGHSLSGEKPGGYVTTLHEKDLADLQKALAHPSTPLLNYAYICPTIDSTIAIASALKPPSKSSTSVNLETVQMAQIYATLPSQSLYKYVNPARFPEICTWIDQRSKDVLTWDEKLTLLNCPIAWRDKSVVSAAEDMIKMQRDEMSVTFDKLVRRFGVVGILVGALEEVEREMTRARGMVGKQGQQARYVEEGQESLSLSSSGPRGIHQFLRSRYPMQQSNQTNQEKKSKRSSFVVIQPQVLEKLEALHKILALYMWMHFRNSVVYPDREAAEAMKHRVEVALDWGLQEVGKGEDGEGKVKDMGVLSGGLEELVAGKMWVGEQSKAKERTVFTGSGEGSRSWDGEGEVSRTERRREEGPVIHLIRQHLEQDENDTDPSTPRHQSRTTRMTRPLDSSPTSQLPTSPRFSQRKAQSLTFSASSGGGSSKNVSMDWMQAPKMTMLLKSFVDAPGLRVYPRAK